MAKNRYVNRYSNTQYDGLAVVVYVLICIALVTLGVHFLYGPSGWGAGRLECGECHNVNAHETKKNIQYLQEKKYKDPKRWLK